MLLENKQNTSFLGCERSDEYMQISLHSKILRGKDIGSYSSHRVFKPYFIEENNGNSMTYSGNFHKNLIVERFQEDFQTFWIFISIELEKKSSYKMG